MAARSRSGTVAMVLTATVARRYYLEGKSKLDIAEEYQLSRFKVARLLEQARASGMVQIQLQSYGEVDVELSSQLQAAFKLQHCVVIQDAEDDVPSLRRRLGRATAQVLVEIVEPGDVLGLAWARSLMELHSSVAGLARCTVVQVTGALAHPEAENSSIDLVRDVARVSNGPAFFFHAPMIVANAATAQSLRTQPEIAHAIAQFPSITKAVVAVGLWQPSHSTVVDAIGKDEWRTLHDLGVRAEMSGVLIDAQGQHVPAALRDRTIGIDALQLRAIPQVIATAYDVVKAPAVRAAVTGGFVTGLVTHAALAQELLTQS